MTVAYLLWALEGISRPHLCSIASYLARVIALASHRDIFSFILCWHYCWRVSILGVSTDFRRFVSLYRICVCFVLIVDARYDEETTSILTEWFLAHKRWPYPASKEKDALAKATNLTTLQM